MPRIPLSALALPLVAAPALAQSGPACLSQDDDGNDAHYLWGGEMRQIFTLDTATGEHTWIVGDGGQIRHRFDTSGGGSDTWVFQDTPDDLRTTLLDVHFLNEDDGYACGWGGRLLQTANGGDTWTDHAGTPLTECDGDPAVLWRSRFVDQDLGFAAGLWTFQRWDGTAWSDVTLRSGVGPEATSYDQGWIEFYALDILQIGENWIGVAAGQEWHGTGHCAGASATPGQAVVFYTDSRMELSAGGQVWWRTFDESVYETLNGMEVFVDDPWDLEYAPDATNLDTALLYLAGGKGNADGSIFSSGNGGRTFLGWTLEFGAPNAQGYSPSATLYGVGALEGGGAIACGYAGDIWTRTSGPSWVDATAGNFSGPLADAHAFEGGGDGDNCIVVGSWGFVRETQNASDVVNGVTWTSVNSGNVSGRKKQFRLEDIAFVDDDNGYAVGQFQVLASTTDGGCSWAATKTNSGVANGPPSGPGGKMLALAFDANGTRGIAVGRADLDPTIAKPQTACYVYDSTLSSPHAWGTYWSDVDLGSVLGSIDVELTGATAVDSTTFLAVGTQSNTSTTPLVLLGLYDTGTNTLTWSDVTPSISTDFPSNLKLSDVHAINATEAFAVGYSGTDTPRAYLVQLGASVTLTKIDVSGTGKLTEVASNGSNRFLDDIVAVGSPNRVLLYDPSGMVGTAGTFAAFSPAPPTPALDFTSIAMEGDTILVGQYAEAEALAAADGGRLLRFDGTSWEILKSLTCEAIPAIFLLNDTTGWFLGDGGDLDTEFGTVGDAMVLYYDASGN